MVSTLAMARERVRIVSSVCCAYKFCAGIIIAGHVDHPLPESAQNGRRRPSLTEVKLGNRLSALVFFCFAPTYTLPPCLRVNHSILFKPDLFWESHINSHEHVFLIEGFGIGCCSRSILMGNRLGKCRSSIALATAGDSQSNRVDLITPCSGS